MSHYKDESPLSLVNREAAQHPVGVDDELFAFLGECLRYSRESEGAFDVTVGPLMKAWGFFRGEGRLPTPDDLAVARSRVGYTHVHLDPSRRTVSFARPGVELDLGGIAKGYAIERMAAILRQHRVSAALLSSGGSTLYAIGAPPGRDGWEVELQDPRGSGRVVLAIGLKDEALSIAGSIEKSFERDGRLYSHIMDPRLGQPAQGLLTVAVRTASATAGDALDNAFFVLGVEGTRSLLKRLPPTEAILFLPAAGRRPRDGSPAELTAANAPPAGPPPRRRRGPEARTRWLRRPRRGREARRGRAPAPGPRPPARSPSPGCAGRRPAGPRS